MVKTVDPVLHRFQWIDSSGHLTALHDLCRTERQVLLAKGLQVLLAQRLGPTSWLL